MLLVLKQGHDRPWLTAGSSAGSHGHWAASPKTERLETLETSHSLLDALLQSMVHLVACLGVLSLLRGTWVRSGSPAWSAS